VTISAALDNVVVNETLHDALEYVSATATLNGVSLGIPPVQSGQTLSWALGTIPAGQQVVITLTTRVANNSSANGGTSFTNTASYTYTDIPAGGVTDGSSGPVTLVEPDLSLAKTVSPAAPPSAGDTLSYTVTLTAASGANYSSVFDADLVDTLSLGLAYVTGSARVSGVPVEPAVTGDGLATTQTLTWSGGLDVPEGTSAPVTYDVRVLGTVVAGQVLTNNVSARWTSLDDANAYERTGSGIPTYNDYFTSAVSTSLTVSDNNSLTKEIIADTYVEAPSTLTDKVLRIGDTATYRLTLKLGEGTTLSVGVEDVLPTGMAYDQLVSISPSSGSSTFTYSVLSEPSPGDTSLAWNLGDVVNTPSNDNTPFDALVIEYQARVMPDAGLSHTPTLANLTNTATLSYTDAGGNTVVDPARLVSSDTLTLWQPVMSSVAKSDRLGRSGTLAVPLNVNVATDIMQFRLQSCNSGAAPAYNVQFTDVLASQLDENSITVPVISVAGVALGVGDYLYTPPAARGGAMSFNLNRPIGPGQCVTVDYDIGFHTDFGPNQVWNNSATLDEYWSLPAQSGQRYVTTGSSQFYMTNPVSVTPLSKVLVSPVEATIGEEALFEITVPSTAIGAALDNVLVSDTLHDALEYVSATATLDGAPLSVTPTQSGQTLTWALGTIPAGQQVVITLTTRVANNSSANGGLSFSNTASYTYTDIPPGSVTDGTSSPLTLVEPFLSVAKTVTNLNRPGMGPQPGDILRYTVNLTAASGATLTGAFDTDLIDSLSPGLVYVTGTARIGGLAVEPSVTGDGSTTPQTLTWTSAVDVPEAASVPAVYDVRVLDTVVAGQVLSNSVTVLWTGLDGPSSYERTGADGIGGLNDYVVMAAAPPLTVPIPALTFQKSVDQPVANPGDRLRYTLVIQNPTPTRVDNFILIDQIERLNATLGFQPGSITNVSIPAGASSAISADTLNVTGLNIGPNETLTVVFEALLATNLRSASVVLNQAELQGPWPTPILSDDPALPGREDPTRTVIPANGVVYDAVSRAPLQGVTLTLELASTGNALPASCFIDPSQQNQVTSADGTYKFDPQFDPTNCPDGEDYLIAVTGVPGGYVAGPSLVIPPSSGATTSAYSVALCPADALPTAECEAQVSPTAPTGSATTYYLHLTLGSGANQIYNNHIPVDPYVEEKVSISKTTSLVNVSRGQLVPYTITVKNTLRSPLPPLGVIDTIPAGFKYVEGSSRVDDMPQEPVVSGRRLEWNDLSVGYNEPHTIRMVLVVGSGVSEGEYVNQAQVFDTQTGGPFSEVATATVRAVPDATFDCTDVIGKVFDDRNLNGYQDTGETGLSMVRVVTARGLIATTDEYGRFHITCALTPDADRGSNFILKLDDRTLPTGYRMTTENPRVQRATRGKMLRFNFGATIHRVVRLDIADGVFETDTTELRIQWAPRIDRLLEELRRGPSVLRLSYLGDVEREGLVQERLEALKREITERWEKSEGGYRLAIETEIFWRRGASPAGP